MEEKVLLRNILNLDDVPKDELITVMDADDHVATIISNYNEWAYMRLQIRKYKIEGCYFYFDGKRYEINSNGMLPEYPSKLFYSGVKMAAELALRDSAPKYIPKSKIIDIEKCPINDYVDIYDNEDNLICHTNDDLEFNWVRAEIRERKLEGCYLIFNNQKIGISEYGDPFEYPNEMFKYIGDQYCRML